MKRTEESLRDLWDNIKRNNIQIIGAPEEEEKKTGYEKISQHGKGNNQVQKAQRVPYRTNPWRNTTRHTPIKLTKAKHKERILKQERSNK